MGGGKFPPLKLGLLLLPLLLQGIEGFSIPDNFSIYDYQPLLDKVEEEVDEVFAGGMGENNVTGVIFCYYLNDDSTPAGIFENFTPSHIPTREKYFLRWKFDKENNYLFLTKYQISPTYETLEEFIATNYFATGLYARLKYVEEVFVKDSEEFLRILKNGEVDYNSSSSFKKIMEGQTMMDHPAYYVLRDAEGLLDTESMSTEEIFRDEGLNSSNIRIILTMAREHDIEYSNMYPDTARFDGRTLKSQQILFYPCKTSSLEILEGRRKPKRFSPLYNLLYITADGTKEIDRRYIPIMEKIHIAIGSTLLKGMENIHSCLKKQLDVGFHQRGFTAGGRGNLALTISQRVKHTIEDLYSYNTKGTYISGIVEETDCETKYEEYPEFPNKWRHVLIFAKIYLAAKCDGTSDFPGYSSTLNRTALPFRKLLEEQKDTFTWYALLHKILCLATTPSYRHKMGGKNWFGGGPGDYHWRNNQSGAAVIAFKNSPTQNLYEFLKEVFQDDVTDYHGEECCSRWTTPPCLDHTPFCGEEPAANRKEKINNLKITEEPLGELQSVLKQLFFDACNYHCDSETVQVTITGNIISAMDIIKEAGSNCISSTNQSFQQLQVFAKNGIYIDGDMGAVPQFKDAQVIFMAPYIYRSDGNMDSSTVEYQRRTVWKLFEGFMDKTFTNVTMIGSILITHSGNNNLNAETGLAKSINRFILYGRQNTRILGYLNYNLEKLIDYIKNDEEILRLRCQNGGVKDEQNLLRMHEFYRLNATTKERQGYIEEFKELRRICREEYTMEYNSSGVEELSAENSTSTTVGGTSGKSTTDGSHGFDEGSADGMVTTTTPVTKDEQASSLVTTNPSTTANEGLHGTYPMSTTEAISVQTDDSNTKANDLTGMTQMDLSKEEVVTTPVSTIPRVNETGPKQPSGPSITVDPSWNLVILGGIGGASLLLCLIIIGVIIRYGFFVNVRNTVVVKYHNPNHY